SIVSESASSGFLCRPVTEKGADTRRYTGRPRRYRAIHFVRCPGQGPSRHCIPMKMKLPASRSARVVLAIVALIVAFIVWRNVRLAPPPVLATSPVVKGDIENTVVATGSLEAFKLISVGAQASGQIKSLKVQLGDKVKAGDLIAE